MFGNASDVGPTSQDSIKPFAKKLAVSLKDLQAKAIAEGHYDRLPLQKDLRWSEVDSDWVFEDGHYRKRQDGGFRWAWLEHTGQLRRPAHSTFVTTVNFEKPPKNVFYELHLELYKPGTEHIDYKPPTLEALSRYWTQPILAWGLNVSRLDLYRLQLDTMHLWVEATGYIPNMRCLETNQYHESRDRYRFKVLEEVEVRLADLSPRWPDNRVPSWWRRCAVDWLLIQFHTAAKKAYAQGQFGENGKMLEEGRKVWSKVLAQHQQQEEEVANAQDRDDGFDAPDLDNPPSASTTRSKAAQAEVVKRNVDAHRLRSSPSGGATEASSQGGMEEPRHESTESEDQNVRSDDSTHDWNHTTTDVNGDDGFEAA